MAGKNKLTFKSSVDYSLLIPYVFVCICLGLTTLVYIVFRGKLPPQVPLFYGQAAGARQIVSKNLLLLPLFLSLMIASANYVTAYFLIKDRFLRHILSGLSIFISIVTAIAILKVVMLVGNI